MLPSLYPLKILSAMVKFMPSLWSKFMPSLWSKFIFVEKNKTQAGFYLKHWRKNQLLSSSFSAPCHPRTTETCSLGICRVSDLLAMLDSTDTETQLIQPLRQQGAKAPSPRGKNSMTLWKYPREPNISYSTFPSSTAATLYFGWTPQDLNKGLKSNLLNWTLFLWKVNFVQDSQSSFYKMRHLIGNRAKGRAS